MLNICGDKKAETEERSGTEAEKPRTATNEGRERLETPGKLGGNGKP